jgi:hypothetical protein
MEARYNVYFAGQVLDGHSLATVRANMASLFKADEATLNKLFSGKTQLVKRDCDKATALKYKQAIERAGAVPVIQMAENTTAPEVDSAADKEQTAAERIAALATAPDLGAQAEPDQPETGETPHNDSTEFDIELTPTGTAVLHPEERPVPATSTVDTPDLEVSASGQRLSDKTPAPPPAPDTSHLSEGLVGETLPNLPSSEPALDPDTSAIALSPEGTDFSDCAGPTPTPPELDLSGIDLAPVGVEVIEERYKKKQDTPPPATDHLALED